MKPLTLQHYFVRAVLAVVALVAVTVRPSMSNAQPAQTPAQLNQYIELALQQNPDVMAARARFDQANARVDQANASLWPRIDVNATYTSFSGGRIITIPGIGAFSTASIGVIPWDNNISASWNIFNYAIWQAGKASHAYLAAATASELASELTTSYQVSDAYYAYAKSAELVQVRQNAVELAKQNLASTEALFKNDKAPKNDVLRAQVAVASSQGDLLAAKNQQNLARTNFNNLLKRDIDAAIDLPPSQALVDAPNDGRSLAQNSANGNSANDGSLTSSALPSTSLQQDLNQALHDRPELRQLTESQTALEGLRAVNVADYIPNVSLFARYGWQENKLQFSSADDYFTAGVQFHWNLFAGFGTNAHVAENDAQIRELDYQKESLINGIRIELQNARLELENAHERRDVAKTQLASAAENERITKLQYDAGMAPLITMIDAQTTLANAQANLTTTTYDVLLADAKYRKALGQH